MDRRMTVLGAVALLLCAFVVVQIVDPRFGERTPPEVDFSEPPNEIAADSAAQFEYVDYAYRVDIAYDENVEWRQWSVTRIDHSGRAYRKIGPGGERQEVLYGTTTAGFVRPGIDSDWYLISDPDFVYPVPYLTKPVDIDEVRDANATIMAENSSTVEIRVDVNPLKVEGNYPGDATLVVDKENGMIQTVHVTYNPNERGTQYLRFRVIDTDTTIERPKSLPITPGEMFWDLIRGPLFRIEWFI